MIGWQGVKRMCNRGGLFLPKYRNLLLLRLFIPFGAGYFLSMFLGSTNAVMSSALISEFSLSPGDLGFMTSAYLIFFGLSQFPLGVFLDRYGARATLAPMLLFAVAGALVFASAHSLVSLIAARALMGIGLSGCLMSAFKAYASWLPVEKLPLIYSFESLMGGIGGMAATCPVKFVMDIIGWRAVFTILAVTTFCVSALIWFAVPKDTQGKASQPPAFICLLRGMLALFADKRFLHVMAPITAAESVAFAYLHLWIGPWMLDVAGLGPAEAGTYMMLAFGGAAVGYFCNGLSANWLRRRGWLSWEGLYLASAALLALSLVAIAVLNNVYAAPIWGFTMFMSTMTMIAFPISRGMYAGAAVGRALSLLNFMIFFSSFITQWLIGIVLELYPVNSGHFSPEGHRLCVAGLAVFNFASCLWYYNGLKTRKIDH